MKLDWRIVAPLLIVIAGILWGVIGLFSTALSSAGLEPVQITVVRCTIAACFLGIGGVGRFPRHPMLHTPTLNDN